MIEYTAIKHDDNQLVITMDNKCKDLLHNIDFEFKIIKELWYINDDEYGTISYDYEPRPIYGEFDYEVTLEFKNEYHREYFDYLFFRYISQVEGLEYIYKELEVNA